MSYIVLGASSDIYIYIYIYIEREREREREREILNRNLIYIYILRDTNRNPDNFNPHGRNQNWDFSREKSKLRSLPFGL